MKRILALLTASMLVMALTACVDTTSSETQKPSDVSTVDSSSTDSSSSEESSEESSQTEQSTSKDAAIEETVLLEDSGIKITAKELSTGIFGAELKVLIENDSGKDLTIQTRNSSVNGYMVETMMSSDVANGKNANDTITFMSAELEACGIDSIADMEFSFHIFETSSWDDYLNTDPVQLKTSLADTYEYTFDDTGDVAYEGNGVKIVIKGLAENGSFLGSGVVVYAENTGDKAVTIQAQNVSVNGFMIDPIFSCDIAAGKHAVDEITFMDTELEENDITKIEDVELSFHIFDMSSWDTIADTDTVTIKF